MHDFPSPVMLPMPMSYETWIKNIDAERLLLRERKLIFNQ